MAKRRVRYQVYSDHRRVALVSHHRTAPGACRGWEKAIRRHPDAIIWDQFRAMPVTVAELRALANA